MSIQNNYVAIMAGGIGSRFWPESRQKLPKQFLDLLGMNCSLIQATYRRFIHVCPKENIYIITHESYVSLVREQLPQVAPENIIAEPSRKNTAPGAAFFAHKLYALNPHANILIAPADHLITNERSFESQVFQAFDFVARRPALVTVGIKPTRPDTGYGYLQFETEEGEPYGNFHKVKTFTEKPNLELARAFLKSGDFLWNSGIFVWNVQVILEAFQKYLPEMNEVFVGAADALNTDKEPAVMEMIYTQCTNISIDYGIMEKADNVFVLPSTFGWSDLGTWESAYEYSEKDYLGNAVSGTDVMIVDASECMVKAIPHKLVVLQGLEQFIVVDTPDVLLVCERSREQEIKAYVAEIKRNKGERFL